MKDILNKAADLWRKTNKTQLLRHGVQFLAFLLFPGLFLTVFNALKDVIVALLTGTFALSAVSGSLVTLTVVLGVTILWGRFFCGYLCTFGALQELMAFAGKKLFPNRRKVPEKADRLLKYVKYGLLLTVVLLLWALQLPVDSSLSPWGVFGALLSGNLTVMAEAVPTVGFGLLLAILALSLFVERAFCRYFCPLGALFTPLSAARPLGALFTPLSAARLFRIRRLETACTGCQQCSRDCAMGVTVHEDAFVRSGECIDCMRCLAVCHPEALKTAPTPAVAGTASALALCGLIQVGRIAVPEQSASPSLSGEYASEQVVSADDSSPAARYVDGVYTGTGTGFRGAISAQVTVESGRITDVTILSSSDDKDFFQRAQNGVIPAILQEPPCSWTPPGCRRSPRPVAMARAVGPGPRRRTKMATARPRPLARRTTTATSTGGSRMGRIRTSPMVSGNASSVKAARAGGKDIKQRRRESAGAVVSVSYPSTCPMK